MGNLTVLELLGKQGWEEQGADEDNEQKKLCGALGSFSTKL